MSLYEAAQLARNSLATVPANVTIPAGATSTTFMFTTQSVHSTTSVTISGFYGGMTPSATLTATSRHYQAVLAPGLAVREEA